MSRARTLAGAIGSDGALNVADVAGLAAVASSGSASDLTTGTLPNARLASGAAVANLGYTPVNKAGDTTTGHLTVGQDNRILFDVNTNSASPTKPQVVLNSSGTYYSHISNKSPQVWAIGLTSSASGMDNSDVIRWNGSGYVQMPNQPVFFGRGAANRDANYAVQGALFKFETITTNTGSRYDSSTGLFTAPVAGNYLVCWNILVDDNNSTIGQMASVRINGSDRYWAYSINALAYMPTTLVNIVSLSANDTISFYCYAKIHGGTDTSASICLLS